jgi:hypothetical protein
MIKIEWTTKEGIKKQEIKLDIERQATDFIKGLEEGEAKKIIVTKYPSKVHVAVIMWGGTIEEVKVFSSLENAVNYKAEKDIKWAQYLDYEGVRIFETNIERD